MTSILDAEITVHLHKTRHFASFCLVAADPGWTDVLILQGSPVAGLWLLSDITMRPLILLPVRIVRDGAQCAGCAHPSCHNAHAALQWSLTGVPDIA